MADEFRGLPPRTVPTQPLAKLIANQAQKCLAPKMLVPGTLFFGARPFVLGQIGPNLVPGTLLDRQNALLALSWH